VIQTLAVVLGYLLGSIPFAYLLARRGGIDIRRVGSGNVGAANTLRTRGTTEAVIVVCLDAMKGSCAVVIAERLATGQTTSVAAGLASIVGHIYPVWLGFRGGKGVATTAGVFAVLAPIALAIAGGVFVLAVWITRFISMGSIAAAVILAAAALAQAPRMVAIGAVVAAVLVVERHRGNLARLMDGTERRIGQFEGTPLRRSGRQR
jgi:glycerol-3-phosphate acyltransferase PlsY